MLEVRWNEVERASFYEVFYSTTSNFADAAMISAGTTSAVIPNLANGTSYTVWVGAGNSAGKSPGYDSSSITLPSAGGTPQIASAAPAGAPVIKEIKPANKRLTLTWDQVSGVPAYRIFYSETGGVTESMLAQTDNGSKI